jgi:hypothetical protein
MSSTQLPNADLIADNDFVFRDGFPALRNEKGEPILEGDEPIPKASFLSYTSALKLLNQFESLIYEDCQTVFTARTKDDSEAYSIGCTYFVPVAMKPRCALENLALRIFHEHTKDLPKGCFIPEQSGSEWWTLVLDANPPNPDDQGSDDDHDEVGMHFDADYGLEDQAPGLLLHPRVATVTYLSNFGAPTIVLERKSPPMNQVEKLEGDIHRGWLSSPSIGKHIAFDGSLLHGAPATFFPGITPSVTDSDKRAAKRQKLDTNSEIPQGKRITFLVNIWLNHCPLDAELLDDEIIEQLKTPCDMDWNVCLDKMDDMEKIDIGICKDDPAGEEEIILCGRVVTLFYNESMEKQHNTAIAACRDRTSYELNFDRGSLMLKVGDPVSEDNDQNDSDIE